MAFKVVLPEGFPPPLAPYSPGVQAGSILYVSGTLSVNSKGELVGAGDVRAQTRQVLENIKAVLTAAGAGMRNITFNQIFLKDLAHYASMNEIYQEYFPGNAPARYCIRVDLVKPEFLVEIVSTAHIG